MNTTSRQGRVSLYKDQLRVDFEYNPRIVAAIKTIPDARFKNLASGKFWTIPIAELPALRQLGFDFRVDYDAHLAWLAHDDARKVAEAAARHTLDLWRTTFDKTAPLPDGRRLRAYQIEAIEFLVEKRFAILADEMGSGKTLAALIAAAAFDLPIYLVAPSFVLAKWVREAAGAGVMLAHVASWDYRKIPDPPEGAYGVIFDEAHYMMNPSSARAKKALTLADDASFVFLLTGTPMKGGMPVNLFALLKAVRHELARNRRAYEIRYCGGRDVVFPKSGRKVWMTDRAQHLDELRDKTRDVLLRRTKEQLMDLPPLVRITLPADVDDDAEHAFQTVYNAKIDEWQQRVERGEAFGGAEALVELNALRQAASLAKVNTTADVVAEALENERGVLVFVAFKHVIEPLTDAIRQRIARRVVIDTMTGDVSAAQRDLSAQAFQHGDIDVIISTYGAGGVGIDLYRADTVVLHDRPWDPGEIDQATSRAHRNGQASQRVTEFWIQYGPDDQIDQLVGWKQDQIDHLLDGKPSQRMSPATIAKRVMRDLLKGGRIIF